jgi:hypothetical protein
MPIAERGGVCFSRESGTKIARKYFEPQKQNRVSLAAIKMYRRSVGEPRTNTRRWSASRRSKIALLHHVDMLWLRLPMDG